MTALRSGEYVQRRNQLGRLTSCGTKEYCCEGVAAERYGALLGHEVRWDNRDLGLDGFADWAEDDFWHALGLAVTTDDAGSAFAFVLPEGKKSRQGFEAFSYMGLNDDGFTFSQIADLIEWQFLP